MNFPPLHPLFVGFTVALVPVSVLSDWLGRLLNSSSLTATGWWALLYSSIITPLAVGAGWLWLRSMPPMNVPEMTIHKFLGTEMAFFLFALVWWRYGSFRRTSPPGRLYLAVATVVVLALIVQGYLGGKLTFNS
jgi:uncharacterized membrane protein